MVEVVTLHDTVAALECVPLVSTARVFRAMRPIRLGDASPGGRCRLDSLARYLQDIAKDDGQDTGVVGNDLHGWVVRRTLIDVYAFPTYLQRLSLATWVAGLGSHWAERRTQMTDESGRVLVDASAIWVHIDMKTMRPRALTPTLREVWGPSTGGREVGARQVVKPSIVRASDASHTTSAWVTRFSDFDALEHMNNAAYWEIMEEQLLTSRHLRENVRFLVEHHDGITPGAKVNVHRFDVSPHEVTLLVEADGAVQAGMWFGTR